MDDCNQTKMFRDTDKKTVQIPLWTIVTTSLTATGPRRHCSDSSMDDCNQRAEIEAELKECSDSSMDDCNKVLLSPLFGHHIVQIPLWTIVTLKPPP